MPHHAPAVNSTMLIQIALLAWAFLGESLGGRQIAGLVVASLGTLVVQVGAGRGGAWPAAGVNLAAEVAATRAAVRPDVSGLRAAGGSAGRRSARSGEGCR